MMKLGTVIIGNISIKDGESDKLKLFTNHSSKVNITKIETYQVTLSNIKISIRGRPC